MTEETSSTVRASAMSTAVPWLLSAKVEVPTRVDTYFSRPRLFQPSEGVDSRIVVVQTPGGFGKTTLLGEICRRARERGVLTAWLTLDEDDTGDGIGTYLAYAFERGGLHIPSASDAIEHGLTMVARSVEAHAAPCLLVLDELERVTKEAVSALNFLLRHLPDNLRVVLGMRENPGLDLAWATLNGRGIVLTAEQLRFSRQEIVDFFDGQLSRRELADITVRTEGWPVALCLYRNVKANEPSSPANRGWAARDLPGADGIAANWLGARLLRNVTGETRDFLLDISLFDWIEVALVNEVLGRKDSKPKASGLLSLQGLIQPMGDDGDTMRLHPLLGDYCAARLQREDPDRYRWLHREIAVAMERRGHLIPAMRHADAAGDARLAGDILERAGGLRLWLREGVARLGAAERFLTPDLLESHPRLALLRCRVLIKNARFAEARRQYESVRAQTHDFTQDPNSDSNDALRVDALIVKAPLAGYGCMPITRGLIRDVETSLGLVEREEKPDLTTLASHKLLFFVAHYQAARFDLAREFAAEAQSQYALSGTLHGRMHVTLHEGLLAMAEGRSDEAQGNYERAGRIAKEHFPHDHSLPLIINVLSAELDLERDRTERLEPRVSRISMPLRDVAVLLDIRAAALEVTAEWKFETGGAEEALAAVEEARDFALNEGLVSAERHVSALQVVYLILDGQIDRAARAWRGAGLPEDLPKLLDLDNQSWREMEAIACARIRLLAARDEFESARELASVVSRIK